VLLGLQFLYRSGANHSVADHGRVAIFPGAWNPPTTAHVEIARAARKLMDEVVLVLPRAFPHKSFEGASFDARCRMLETLAKQEGFSAAVSEGGLYAAIADEARDSFGPSAEIALVCGRDAAQRIAAWDYGSPRFFDDFVERYRLLVAARAGDYEPASHHSERILRLPMETSWDDVSSSDVRRRIAAGENWRDLVPPAIADLVNTLY
jgi:nicotinate-nucleotide adenylyltransferase